MDLSLSFILRLRRKGNKIYSYNSIIDEWEVYIEYDDDSIRKIFYMNGDERVASIVIDECAVSYYTSEVALDPKRVLYLEDSD